MGLAGLAQMDVHIDEARGDGEAGGIEDLGSVGGFELAGGGDLGDAALLEQNVLEGIDAGGRIDEVAAANDQCRHARPPFPAVAGRVPVEFSDEAVRARSRTAMRMATPWRTCSRISD